MGFSIASMLGILLSALPLPCFLSVLLILILLSAVWSVDRASVLRTRASRSFVFVTLYLHFLDKCFFSSSSKLCTFRFP